MALLIFAFSGIFIILLYGVLITGYAISIFSSFKKEISKSEGDGLLASLIVPFRNEEENLPGLIGDIINQSYPAHLFEVILVNDHSTDDSKRVAEALTKNSENIRVISLPPDLSGKKSAILLGINNASGEWIIQTDADCRIQPEFIKLHCQLAAVNKDSLIAGPVIIKDSGTFWTRMELFEQMSLAGSTLGSFLRNRPIMCNGANLSYGRNFYLSHLHSLEGSNTPSGDDIFLLIEAKKSGLKLNYLGGEQAVVHTNPSASLRAFMEQRIRWGSKARLIHDRDMVLMAILVWLANATVLGTLVAGITSNSTLFLFLGVLLTKSLFDFLLLWATLRYFQSTNLLRYFPLMALFYYFYLVFAGILSVFKGYSWKGRNYK